MKQPEFLSKIDPVCPAATLYGRDCRENRVNAEREIGLISLLNSPLSDRGSAATTNFGSNDR
jgi:hypothetical protein